MRVVFYAEPDHRFDRVISAMFRSGVRACGDRCEVLPISQYDGLPHRKTDVAAFLGVKNKSRLVYDSHRAAGKHIVILDKGYTRIRGGPLGTAYWRTVVDDFQPHAYLMTQPFAADRWEALKLKIQPMRRDGCGQVLFCGGSQKYCNWHGLGGANEYAKTILDSLRCLTSRAIVYRPKPSWVGAAKIEPHGYSHPETTMNVELAKTFHVVTFGSNAAFEALLCGVPAVVLGDGIARSLSRTSVADAERPLYPSLDAVQRLACAVAYQQWTLQEMRRGDCWQHLRQQL